ncbi:hypothetical protein CHU98_g3061 [Xylaria longipes]|nr:hypothetical protein CHU98_g3061 [Xylaria longipes]
MIPTSTIERDERARQVLALEVQRVRVYSVTHSPKDGHANLKARRDIVKIYNSPRFFEYETDSDAHRDGSVQL